MFRRRIGGIVVVVVVVVVFVVVVVVVVVEDGLGEHAPKKLFSHKKKISLWILTVMAVSWANRNLFE
jgi:hypothetical protein